MKKASEGVFLELYSPKRPGHCAVVDPEDYERLRKFVWYYTLDNAGTRKPDQKTKPHPTVKRRDPKSRNGTNLMMLHRHILGISERWKQKIRVSHKNNDPMDFRKENLVIVFNGILLSQLIKDAREMPDWEELCER